MTLVEDARRLDELPCDEHGYEHCLFCPQVRIVPRIVAALEAMQEILEFIDEEGCVDRCVDITRAMLVKALQGEGVTA